MIQFIPTRIPQTECCPFEVRTESTIEHDEVYKETLYRGPRTKWMAKLSLPIWFSCLGIHVKKKWLCHLALQGLSDPSLPNNWCQVNIQVVWDVYATCNQCCAQNRLSYFVLFVLCIWPRIHNHEFITFTISVMEWAEYL